MIYAKGEKYEKLEKNYGNGVYSSNDQRSISSCMGS